MIQKTETITYLAVWRLMFCAAALLLVTVNAVAGEIPPAPGMPADWKAESDFVVPSEQIRSLSAKLNADLVSVRNILYDVTGKRVQLNVIVLPDAKNAERLMTKLRLIKVEEALLQKGLIVYEFVGQNDVLPLIREGRRHLEGK